VSKDGIGNLAPISFFTGTGPQPPSVFLGLQPRSDGVTPKVISHTKQAVASTEIAASF
jgi:flavin reductase (DIM6/NTAB) family NADH-FMN oxidoreductase RutF